MAVGRLRSHSNARPKNNSLDIWIYGHHAVMAALKNADRKTKRILLSKDGHLDSLQYAQNTEIKLEMVSPHQLEALLPPSAVHQGIAALVSNLPEVNIEKICNEAKTRKRGVIIVLDKITDPRNIGSIIRSGAFFGAFAVITQDRHSPTLNGIIAKAASGGMEKIPVVRVKNISRSLEKLKLGGFWCVGLDSNSTNALNDYVPNNLTAIVLGFAHTLGEFGVVLMVGGNIPGKTKVISIEIYDRVEVLEYTQAHILSASLLIFSFLVLVMVYSINRKLPVQVT